MHSIETIGLAILIFASTNLDDFLLLLTFFADGRSSKPQVIFGQYLGVGALVIASLAIAWGALILPQHWIGFMGIVPLVFGIKDLVQLRKPFQPEKRSDMVDTALVSRRSTLTIAGVTVANGGDNLSAYAPLFATMNRLDVTLMVLTFCFLVGVWCGGAYWFVKVGHATVQHERTLKYVTPVVLILLGIWILSSQLGPPS